MAITKIKNLRKYFGEIFDLTAANSLLHWDQETYMPPKAAEGRGEQLATLSSIAHRLFTRDEMGELLTALVEEKDSLSEEEAALVEETFYDYKRQTCLPEAFVHELALEQSRSYNAWVKARKESDFSLFEPRLEAMVGLLRQKAEYFGYTGSPYNALLEEYERGATAEQIREIFAGLATRQADLIQRIVNSPNQADLKWLDADWDETAQWDFGMKVLGDIGFDFEAGRQDKSIHPFTTSFDLRDVRVTTRISSKDLFSGLYSTLHEGGHGLYEQGFNPDLRKTVLAQAPSLGIHESQSRMWENMIGRSLPFWRYCLPVMGRYFPAALESLKPEDLYRAVNHVAPSLIRVEADECTYNMHIILRFEIETALIEGSLKVSDIPEAWASKMKGYLGVDVPNDAQGCLQDIHWSHGLMGYFPTYALGNLYAAQLFERILQDIPDLWEQVEQGKFASLLGWLREKVHHVGKKKVAPRIIAEAAGQPISAEPYLRYLESKYTAIYGL